jgi:4-azaleucine resistance transporter AzlC
VAPLTLSTTSFGVAYGVLATTAGMGVLAPIVMSATTFAGAAQFAAASVLRDGGSVLAAVAAAALLNARYLAISVSVAPAFGSVSQLRRLIDSQLIVDESWAVAQVGGGRIDKRVLVGAGLVLFPCWVGGTAIGVFGGGVLGDPKRLGLDAAFPALFLALLLALLVNRRTVAAAAAGALIALALLPITPAGVPVIAAGAVCLPGLLRR